MNTILPVFPVRSGDLVLMAAWQVIYLLDPSSPKPSLLIFEIGSNFVALADLELIRPPRLAFNQGSSYFSLQSAGITGLCYHISRKRF